MFLKSVVRAMLILQIVLSAQAAETPAEVSKRELTRSAETPLEARAVLSKNFFKKVTEQVPYTESVPYEAEETYIEKVPYQAEESYIEQVPYTTTETYYEEIPYQETETYVESIPYTESVPYQDTETYYEREYQCRSVTKYRNECRNETKYRNECRSEQECYLVPGDPGREECRMVEECGTNERGERKCKSRRVCERGGSSEPRRECKQVQKCEQVAYNDYVCRNEPYTDQECGYENVARTRTVTKYRNETHYRNETRTRTVTKYRSEPRTRTVTKYRDEERTRTVTRYRDEERTRIVTRYRDETRCCRPELVDRFDYQASYNVKIIFPEATQLMADEKETFELKLVRINEVQNRKEPVVELKPLQTLFKYEVVKQEVQNDLVVIELRASPKLTIDNVGKNTVDLALSRTKANEMKVQIVDRITSLRFQSQYHLLVQNAQTEEVVFDQAVQDKQALVVVDPTQAYKVELQVLRESALLVGYKAEFKIEKIFEKGSLTREDLAILKDRFQITIEDVQPRLAQTQFRVRDATREFTEVVSSYRVIINQYQGKKIVRLSEKTWFRKDLPEVIKLEHILTAKQLTQLKSGVKLQIHVIGKRKISSPLGSGEVSLERSKDVSL